MTPFGNEVLPEVNWRKHRSLGETTAGSLGEAAHQLVREPLDRTVDQEQREIVSQILRRERFGGGDRVERADQRPY